MTPAAAEARCEASGWPFAVAVATPPVAEELERLRKWWTLDVMLPIIGLQPAVDAYLRAGPGRPRRRS